MVQMRAVTTQGHLVQVLEGLAQEDPVSDLVQRDLVLDLAQVVRALDLDQEDPVLDLVQRDLVSDLAQVAQVLDLAQDLLLDLVQAGPVLVQTAPVLEKVRRAPVLGKVQEDLVQDLVGQVMAKVQERAGPI